jgi:hypothetical protein
MHVDPGDGFTIDIAARVFSPVNDQASLATQVCLMGECSTKKTAPTIR